MDSKKDNLNNNDDTSQLLSPSLDKISAQDGSNLNYVDFQQPPKAGIFILKHVGGVAFFGSTWDSENEKEKQLTLLKSGNHPSRALTNHLLSDFDFDANNITYSLISEYTLPPQFNLDSVQTTLDTMRDEFEKTYKQNRIAKLFNLFNKFQMRRAIPKIFAHVLTEREMERFAASVEVQKFARIYIAKCRAHSLRQYRKEQQVSECSVTTNF